MSKSLESLESYIHMRLKQKFSIRVYTHIPKVLSFIDTATNRLFLRILDLMITQNSSDRVGLQKIFDQICRRVSFYTPLSSKMKISKVSLQMGFRGIN